MNRPSHILYGVCLAGAVAIGTRGTLQLGPVTASTIVAAPFAVIGSYLPDIDVKNSNMRKRWITISKLLIIPTTLVMFLLLLDVTNMVKLGILSEMIAVLIPIALGVYFNLVLALQLKHRTYTHSYYMPVLFYLGAYLIQLKLPYIAEQINSMIYGITIGYLSHLIADSCTTKGAFVAYPIPIRVHLLPPFLRVKTGTWREKVFSVIVILITIAYIYFEITRK